MTLHQTFGGGSGVMPYSAPLHLPDFKSSKGISWSISLLKMGEIISQELKLEPMLLKHQCVETHLHTTTLSIGKDAHDF